MNEIITVITNDQTYQTTRKTLQKSNYLISKISDNTIKLNMSSKNFDIILNYLRDNVLPDDISDVENDLKVCGIIYDEDIDSENMVNINVGGKIFNVDKEFLKSKLEYFVKFFYYNEKHNPDYTGILIDRCFYKFQNMINYLKNPWKYALTEEIKNELCFYMSNIDTEVEEFIDTDKFSFFQLGCHKYNNKSASWQLICKDDIGHFFLVSLITTNFFHLIVYLLDHWLNMLLLNLIQVLISNQ
uniref:Putative BTB_POZ domain-containing protein n=1 Tax=Moumouvirus sp. 'Monve' TaxID=1128131 RepID=H2ECZ0_9VIRU|nr:putative BTB_POZ domain-containing protein [Moumouvirus Monve]